MEATEQELHLHVETSDPHKWLDDLTCLSLMHLDGVNEMADDGQKRAVLRVCLDKRDAVRSRVEQLGLKITGEDTKRKWSELSLR